MGLALTRTRYLVQAGPIFAPARLLLVYGLYLWQSSQDGSCRMQGVVIVDRDSHCVLSG